MTRSEIIELANVLAERKGSKLPLQLMLTHRLQEFCRAHRFHWRRKTLTFTTSGGTATYDLSAPAYGDADDLEQLISVSQVKAAGEVKPLEPLFDVESIETAMAATGQGEPSHYALELGTSFTLRLSPVPAGAYTIRVTYWAVPNPATDSSSDAVSLVPAIWHGVLAKGLEADIWRSVYGETSDKYVMAKREYEIGVADAIQKADFSVIKEWQYVTPEPMVRATR